MTSVGDVPVLVKKGVNGIVIPPGKADILADSIISSANKKLIIEQNSPLVSVVIVNYNGSQYLQRLFSSLNNQSLSKFEMIFVDNASSDNSISIVKKLCKDLRKDLVVKIIKNKRNLGYCEGNNIGALSANGKSRYLVFLNNDTYADTDWLKKLIEKVESDDKAGVVGSKIITTSNNLATIGLACDVYGQMEGIILRHEDKRQATNSIYNKLFYCSGASILVPKEVFRKVGGFDETFFMYHDDIDLCWRVRLAGYKIITEPSSMCYHIKNGSEYGLNLPVWKFYHGIVKNRIRTLLKNYATINVLTYLPRALILIALRGLLSSFTNHDAHYIIALIKGLLWNLKNLRGTLLKRIEVQQLRKVPDNDILDYMLPYSLEIAYFKRLLAHTSDESSSGGTLPLEKGNC